MPMEKYHPKRKRTGNESDLEDLMCARCSRQAFGHRLRALPTRLRRHCDDDPDLDQFSLNSSSDEEEQVTMAKPAAVPSTPTARQEQAREAPTPCYLRLGALTRTPRAAGAEASAHAAALLERAAGARAFLQHSLV
jgi:hypothetical protein